MSERKFPDIRFVDFDAAKIAAEMTADYEEAMKTTVYPGSPERLFILWLADIIVRLKANIDITGKANVPRFAAGDELDSLTELFHDVTRLDASAAVTTIRFTLSKAQSSAQLISAGTRITTVDGNVTFQTEEDVYVPAGELTVDVAAKCQAVGAIGNGYIAGQISSLVDVFPWYDHCENITTSAGGADQETDDELYQRMRESEDTYSTAGPAGGYVYFAKTAKPSVIDAKAISPTPGVVDIYVLEEDEEGGGKLPEQETLDAVYEKANPDKVRAFTDHLFAVAPEVVPFTIDLTYYIPNDSDMSAAAVEAAALSAVKEYRKWQTSKMGRDINPSKLHQLLMEAGIKRVDIRDPVFQKVSDGREVDGVVTPVQVAQLENEIVINGGYEDE